MELRVSMLVGFGRTAFLGIEVVLAGGARQKFAFFGDFDAL